MRIRSFRSFRFSNQTRKKEAAARKYTSQEEKRKARLYRRANRRRIENEDLIMRASGTWYRNAITKPIERSKVEERVKRLAHTWKAKSQNRKRITENAKRFARRWKAKVRRPSPSSSDEGVANSPSSGSTTTSRPPLRSIMLPYRTPRTRTSRSSKQRLRQVLTDITYLVSL